MPSLRQETAQVKREPFTVGVFFCELAQQFREDEVPGEAQKVAYNLIFAIPPLLILTVTIAGLLNNVFSVPVVRMLRDQIAQRAPGSAQDVLNSLVDNAIGQVNTSALSIGLAASVVLAVYGASGGVASLMKTFNRAYGVREERSFARKLGVRLGLTVLLSGGLVVAFALQVFGQRIGEAVADWVGLGDLFTAVWGLLRWPVAVAVILLMLAVLYDLGPNVERSFRWVLPGAIAAAVLWVIATFGFQIYLAVANPGSAYGAAAGAIVFLFFLFVTGIVFILGAEVNVVLQSRFDPLARSDKAELATVGATAAPVSGLAPAGEPEREPRRRGRLVLLAAGLVAGLAGAGLAWARRGDRGGRPA
jgi:membrane protein